MLGDGVEPRVFFVAIAVAVAKHKYLSVMAGDASP